MCPNRSRLPNFSCIYQIINTKNIAHLGRTHFIRKSGGARTYFWARRSGKPTKLPYFTLTSNHVFRGGQTLPSRPQCRGCVRGVQLGRKFCLGQARGVTLLLIQLHSHMHG